MGWLWSSTAPTATWDNPAPQETNCSPNALPTQSTSEPSRASPPPASDLKPLTRDEIADRELQCFLAELESATAAPPSKKYKREPLRPPPASTKSPSYKPTPSASYPRPSNHAEDGDSDEPLGGQLLPTTMSCRTAFDAAFYCNSFGGRFNDLYRYGTLRSCSESWNDFWFCMRTRQYSSPQKEDAIKDHYRKKEWRKYYKRDEESVAGKVREEKGIGKGGEVREGAGSSEIVWRSRARKVEPGTAFVVEYEEFSGSDEEWNARERERRRGVVHGSMA